MKQITKRLLIFMCARKKIKLKTTLPGALILSLLFPLAAHAAAYTVKAGDTLYGIGLRYGVSVRALQEANGISGHLIYPGQQLNIPEKNEPRENAATAQNHVPDPTAAGTPPEEKNMSYNNDEGKQEQLENSGKDVMFYTVLPGDCLYTIAGRHGVSVEALMQANNLSSTLIYPGQTLAVPVDSNRAGRPPADNLPARDLSSRGTTGQAARKILNFAASFLGTGYVYGGSEPRGFDCSGFVRYVFRTAGFDLPHNAADQADFGVPVEKAALQPGDLVFFSYYGSKGINHVGIYAGNDQFIHASSHGGVKYSSLNKQYYRENYRGARRLLGQ